MAISSPFEVVLGLPAPGLSIIALLFSLWSSPALCHSVRLSENAGRVPGQKELSSACQQPRVRDGPVSRQQQIPHCLVQMPT